MSILLLLFFAPILLIILGSLSLGGKLRLSISALTLGAMTIGSICSYLAMKIISADMSTVTAHPRCGLPEVACMICGLFIALLIVPTIGSVFGLINYFINRKARIF